MRTLGGVVLGYLMMVAFVYLSLWLLYQIVGAEGAFQPGVYEVTGLWIVLSFALSVAAAMLGGYVCAAIAPNVQAPKILAIVVLVLGFAFAVPVLTNSGPTVPRAGEVSNNEAMKNARQPPWVALLNPLFGGIGVLIGAGIRTGRREEAP